MKGKEKQSGRPVTCDRHGWHTTQIPGQGTLHHNITLG